MGASPPWTIIREAIVAGETRQVSFPNAIALQVRGPNFIPGLLLRFVEDRVGDALHEWRAEGPGNLIPWGGSGKAELIFPDTVAFPAGTAEVVQLIAYHESAADVLPAIAASAAALQHADNQLLAVGRNRPIAASDFTWFYDSQDVESDWNRDALAIEQRRWSSIAIYLNCQTPPINSEWNLVLQIHQGGDWWIAHNSVATRNQAWQDMPGGLSPAGRIYSGIFQHPFCPWRIGVYNENVLAGVASYHVFRTTKLAARYTI